MKGSIGASLEGKMIVLKEKKLSKTEIRKLGKVKNRKHRIKTNYPILESIASKKNAREIRRIQIRGVIEIILWNSKSEIRKRFRLLSSL